MTYRVSKRAHEDLIDIYIYEATNYGSSQADLYQARLQDACLRLGENPGLGRHCPEIFPGVYRLVCQSHSIFYEKVGSSDCRVEIVRFLHMRMEAELRFSE